MSTIGMRLFGMRQEQFADLVAEYRHWRLANGIVEHRSPYQLLTDNTLTISQRQWLREFNKRWEARI